MNPCIWSAQSSELYTQTAQHTAVAQRAVHPNSTVHSCVPQAVHPNSTAHSCGSKSCTPKQHHTQLWLKELYTQTAQYTPVAQRAVHPNSTTQPWSTKVCTQTALYTGVEHRAVHPNSTVHTCDAQKCTSKQHCTPLWSQAQSCTPKQHCTQLWSTQLKDLCTKTALYCVHNHQTRELISTWKKSHINTTKTWVAYSNSHLAWECIHAVVCVTISIKSRQQY